MLVETGVFAGDPGKANVELAVLMPSKVIPEIVVLTGANTIFALYVCELLVRISLSKVMLPIAPALEPATVKLGSVTPSIKPKEPPLEITGVVAWPLALLKPKALLLPK